MGGVGDQVCQRPLEQGGVSDDVRQRLVDVDVDVWGAGAEAADRRYDDFLYAGRPQIDEDRERLQPAHVQQVADQRRQPVGLGLDRRLELRPQVGRPVDLVLAKAGDRRLDCGQRRAQVVGDGLQQGGP